MTLNLKIYLIRLYTHLSISWKPHLRKNPNRSQSTKWQDKSCTNFQTRHEDQCDNVYFLNAKFHLKLHLLW